MANSNSDQQNPARFNIRLFLAKCKSKWLWYVSTFIVLSIIGAYIHLKNVPKYEVTTNILLYDDSPQGATIQMARQFSLGSFFGGGAAVENEIKVLKSHTVMQEAVKAMGLNVSYIFNNGFKKIQYFQKMPIELVYDKSIADTIRVGMRFNVKVNDNGIASVKCIIGKKKFKYDNVTFPIEMKTPYGDFTLVKTKYFIEGTPLKGKIDFNSYSNAAENYIKKISITIPDRKSDMMTLQWLTSDPLFGEALLDTIVQKYNEKEISDQRERDFRTLQFVENRLISLGDELNLTETELEQFQKAKNTVDLETEAQIIMTQYIQTEALLKEAQTEFDIISQARKFLSNPTNRYSLIPVETSSTEAATLISGYNEMILQRINLATGAKNDNIVLQNLDEQLDAYRTNIVETIDKMYDAANIRLQSLKKNIAEFNSQINQMPSTIKSFRSIGRQQGIKEQLYLFLLQQREESSLRLANAQPKAIIIDEAYTLPISHQTSLKLIGIIVIFLTLVLPSTFLYFRSKIRNRLEAREEVEAATTAPILGEVCHNEHHANIAVKSGINSIIGEMFRMIRANLRFILPRKNEKVIMVTSSVTGEGKTFISVNLAASLALLGKKVLLVEADIRSPKISKYLDIHPKIGLSEYLSSDDISLKSIINSFCEDDVKFDVIAAGPIPPNPSELLSEDRTAEMFTKIREEYDYIIVDSTPLKNVSDSLLLSPFVDATIYVCRLDFTPIEDFKIINEMIADQRLKKLSVVINDVSSKGIMLYGNE